MDKPEDITRRLQIKVDTPLCESCIMGLCRGREQDRMFGARLDGLRSCFQYDDHILSREVGSVKKSLVAEPVEEHCAY